MTSYHYPCLIYRQRIDVEETPRFCLLLAHVGEILKWATIRRLEEEAGAPQRQTNQAKVTAIEKFLTEPKNTIPTSITIAIKRPYYDVKLVTLDNRHYVSILEIKMTEEGKPPGIIIDGQHRLLGIQRFNPQLKISTAILLNADDTEIAFQFIVINNKVSKVPTDHLRALVLHYEKQQLEERLKTARLTLDSNVGFVGLVNSEDASPFEGILLMPTNPYEQRIVPPIAIETSIRYLQQKKVKLFDSEDALLEFFYAIWRTAKTRWPSLWKKDSKLLSKIGIQCFTQYTADALIASYDWGLLDLSEPEQVVKEVETLLRYQAQQFWEVAWQLSSDDTQSAVFLIVESLIQISRNLRAGEKWYNAVKLIDASPFETKKEIIRL